MIHAKEVRIIHQYDLEPDLSYLEQYPLPECAECGMVIDLQEDGSWVHLDGQDAECAAISYDDETGDEITTRATPEKDLNVEEATMALVDKRRLDDYGITWSCVGIYVEVDLEGEHGFIRRDRSAGLWGIETDSDDSYFREIAEDALGEYLHDLEDRPYVTPELIAEVRSAFEDAKVVEKY